VSDNRLTPLERLDRTRARAWALQIHYRWESGGRTGSLRDALVETTHTRRISPRRIPFVRRLLTGLDENIEAVDAALLSALDNWRLERLSTIDRAVLRLGALELLHMEDVPPKVAIQEAIRLAEAYGGSESPRFVNGVLDALFKRLGEGEGVSRPLRVLVVNWQDRENPQGGGAETHLHEIFGRIAARGHEVTLLVSGMGRDAKRRHASTAWTCTGPAAATPSPRPPPGTSANTSRADLSM